MRRLNIIVIAILILPFLLADATAIQISKHDIKINSTESGFSVREDIIGIVENNESSISFSIQEDATDVVISINGQSVEYEKSGNRYVCTIPKTTIPTTNESSIVITYRLPKNASSLEKHILYNTSDITIVYDGTNIFSNSDLKENSYISASLAVKTVAGYLYAFAGLLLAFIVIAIAYLARKRESKPAQLETKEILETKKNLLMMLLKEIEKKHRAEELSDESYHYLKDLYKKEAVEVMKKLES